MDFWIKLNMFFRSFFLQAGWNYVKYQNLGFAFVMMPFLRQLYKQEPENLSAVLPRYLDTFNTHPVMASFCYGAMAKQETYIAEKQSVTLYKEQVAQWVGSRRGLSITAASIGDRLFWGTLKPFTLVLALFMWMILGVNFFETDTRLYADIWIIFVPAVIAFLLYNLIAQFVRWKGLTISYQSDESSCFGLTRFDWNRTIYQAKRLGLYCAVILIICSVYRFMKQVPVFNIHFVARSLLILFFVIISFITRGLRIPNVYLYLASISVFTVVCLF